MFVRTQHTEDTHLNLKADFALLDSKRTSGSSPHEGEASKSHRRCLEAAFVNREAHVTVICNIQTSLLNVQCRQT